MIFKRTQHDGLYAVLNRQGFKKIIFNNGIYETTDQEECNTLFDMGYDFEGDFPEEKKDKKAPELEEHPVTIMGDTGKMPEQDKKESKKGK